MMLTDETTEQQTPPPSQEEVERIAKENAARHPVEFASFFFKQNYPLFKAGLTTLNKKDLFRLCEALVGFPLEVNEPRFNHKNAYAIFKTANSLLEMKAILRLAVQLDNNENKPVSTSDSSNNALNVDTKEGN